MRLFIRLSENLSRPSLELRMNLVSCTLTTFCLYTLFLKYAKESLALEPLH